MAISSRYFAAAPPCGRSRVGFFTHNRTVDLSHARRRLGYRYKWSNAEGISRTIDWYRQSGLLT
jgi:nucleoside-diphosphate-sugar epimerase